MRGEREAGLVRALRTGIDLPLTAASALLLLRTEKRCETSVSAAPLWSFASSISDRTHCWLFGICFRPRLILLLLGITPSLLREFHFAVAARRVKCPQERTTVVTFARAHGSSRNWLLAAALPLQRGLMAARPNHCL